MEIREDFPVKLHQVLRKGYQDFSVVPHRDNPHASVRRPEQPGRHQGAGGSRVPAIQIRFRKENAGIVVKGFKIFPVFADSQMHALSKRRRHIGAGITHHVFRALFHDQNRKSLFIGRAAVCNAGCNLGFRAGLRLVQGTVCQNQSCRILPGHCDPALKFCGQAAGHRVGHLYPVQDQFLQLSPGRHGHLEFLDRRCVPQGKGCLQHRASGFLCNSYFPGFRYHGRIFCFPGNAGTIGSFPGQGEISNNIGNISQAEVFLILQNRVSLASQFKQILYLLAGQRFVINPQIPEGPGKQRIFQILGCSDVGFQSCPEIGNRPVHGYLFQHLSVQIAGHAVSVNDNGIQLPLVHVPGSGISAVVDSHLCGPGLGSIYAVGKNCLVVSPGSAGIQQEIIAGHHAGSLASKEKGRGISLGIVIVDPQRYGHCILPVKEPVRQCHIVAAVSVSSRQIQRISGKIHSGRSVGNGRVLLISGDILGVCLQGITGQKVCVRVKISCRGNLPGCPRGKQSQDHSRSQQPGRPFSFAMSHILPPSYRKIYLILIYLTGGSLSIIPLYFSDFLYVLQYFFL